MAFASQPIAVQSRHDNVVDLATSPMSFKMGSFQNRFYPGASPGQVVGPIAMPDFRRGMAASWDANDANSWLKAMKNDHLMAEDELCRNYTCCGVALPDLHALVDHFESTHVQVLNSPYDDMSSIDTPPTAFDPDDMDISDEQPSPSPPATPSPIMPSAFDPIRIVSQPYFKPSTYSSLAGANGPTTAPMSAFNRYAGYSDYSSNLPGTDPSPTYHVQQQVSANVTTVLEGDGIVPTGAGANAAQTCASTSNCVTPALLFSSSAEPSPLNTPSTSRTGSPSPPTPPTNTTTQHNTYTLPKGTLPLHPQSYSTSTRTASSSSRSHPSSTATVVMMKAFRCPKPGCNKSYKQQNGLKYHLSHGQCNFAPLSPDVERLSDVEREKRLRPYVCKVGNECQRRYKNMNGLRYHYQHSGEHGAIGLEMLNNGRHPLPDYAPTSSSNTPTGSRAPSTAPASPRTAPASPTTSSPSGGMLVSTTHVIPVAVQPQASQVW